MKRTLYRLSLFYFFLCLLAGCTSRPPDRSVFPSPTLGTNPTIGSPLLIFSQQGGPAGFCDQIEVDTRGVATYQASCRNATASGVMVPELMRRLQALAERLQPIHETFEDNPGAPENLKTTLTLNGSGSAEPTQSDLAEIREMATEFLNALREQTFGTPVPGLTDVSMTPLPIFFSQLIPANGERAYPEALLQGTLVIVNDCLRVQASEGDTSYLIIWPPHVVLNIFSDAIQVVDQESQAVAQVGEAVQLGGGETTTAAHIVKELHEPLPATCPGPYWLASGIVR